MLRLCKIGDQTTFSSLLSSVKLKFAENLWVYNLVFCVRAFYTASDDGTKEKYEIKDMTRICLAVHSLGQCSRSPPLVWNQACEGQFLFLLTSFFWSPSPLSS
jgi:hypothetical protein